MKLTVIASQYPFSGRVPLVPPILEYLAALTLRELPDVDVTQVDANQLNISPDEIESEVVAISAMTATVSWAYQFADACRKRGIHVIMGGIHPTALPQEAALHADTVVVGEAESVWGSVLHDVRAGQAKKFYYGERLPLVRLPKPVDGKLKGNYRFRAFFTMRGCPYRCTFCSVRKFFGDTIRYRPIHEVVEEIEACAGNIWFNGDDNIWGGNLQRSTELFSELAKGKKRNWYGFGDLRSIQGPGGEQMLRAARQSGLFSVWVGWESDDAHLRAFNATGKQGRDRVAAVKMMQDSGIDVTLFVVLGGRHDSVDSFKRTIDLAEKLNVGIHPVLLTPLPGTELYEEYREFLLPGLGWDSFVGVKAVFEHPSSDMSPVRRELEYHHLCQELFRFSSIIKRIKAIPSSAFPATHILSFMTQMPMKLAFSKAYDEWKANLKSDVGETFSKVPENTVVKEKLQSSLPAGAGENRGKLKLLDRLGGISLKIYGLSISIISALHFLHYRKTGDIYSIDLAEEMVFGFMLLTFVINLAARELNFARWSSAIRRIAKDKINYWTFALRELAYSALLGTGLYWAYLCMAELL